MDRNREPGLDLIERALGPLLVRWRVIAAWAFGTAAAVALIAIILPSMYTVTVGFVPQTASSTISAVAGLAAQFGVSLPGQDPTQSSDFYAQLLGTDAFYRELLDEPYRVVVNGAVRDTSLLDVYRMDRGLPHQVRIERGIRKLQKHLSITSTPKTQWVEVSFDSRDSLLSYGVAARALHWVDSFNVAMRRTSAAAEVTFGEGRLRDIDDSLRGAEDRAQRFLEANRDFHSSPQLTLAYDRLTRAIALYQGVQTTVQQALEQSRMDAVRNTSVITVVEAAMVPPAPDSRHIGLKAILGFFAGLCVAGGWIMLEARLGISMPAILGEVRRLAGPLKFRRH